MKTPIKQLVGLALAPTLVVSALAVGQGYAPMLQSAFSSSSWFRGGDGAVGSPTFSFTNDPDTGLYRAGANTIVMATNGAEMERWTSNQVVMSADVKVNGGLDIQLAGGRNLTTHTDGALKINGGMTASTATSTNAPVVLTNTNALDANDLVAMVTRSDATKLWSVDKEGDEIVTGDVRADMTGSSTGSPRNMGFINEAGGTASRFYVTGNDGFQGGSGLRMQIGSWWGLDIRGHQESGFPSYVSGGATDTDVRVVGTTTDDDVLAVDGPSGLTADLQEWRVNGSMVAKVSAAGSVVTSQSGGLNIDGTTNGDNGLIWNGTTSSWRAAGGTVISVNPGAGTTTLGAGYVYITGKIATASLPTCNAALAGALVYDTTLKKHVSCNDADGSYGWDAMY